MVLSKHDWKPPNLLSIIEHLILFNHRRLLQDSSCKTDLTTICMAMIKQAKFNSPLRFMLHFGLKLNAVITFGQFSDIGFKNVETLRKSIRKCVASTTPTIYFATEMDTFIACGFKYDHVFSLTFYWLYSDSTDSIKT